MACSTPSFAWMPSSATPEVNGVVSAIGMGLGQLAAPCAQAPVVAAQAAKAPTRTRNLHEYMKAPKKAQSASKFMES
jgi:hypothetical protein